MAVRDSLEALITEVRLHLEDPKSTEVGAPAPRFTDDRIAAALDRSVFAVDPAVHAIYGRMTALTPSLFKSTLGGWETGAYVIRDSAGNVLTPLTEGSDAALGRFAFTGTPTTPITIAGLSYDTYEAAAKVLETAAGKFAPRYSTNTETGAKNPQEAAEGLREQAATLRTRARPIVV